MSQADEANRFPVVQIIKIHCLVRRSRHEGCPVLWRFGNEVKGILG